MINNTCFPARVIIIVLLILPCCIATFSKAEINSFGQKPKIQPHKKLLQKNSDFFKPKTYKFYNTKKSIIKKLYLTSIDNYFLNRLRKLPIKKPRKFSFQKMHVRRDIDYKILSMRVRKDINYLILDITP